MPKPLLLDMADPLSVIAKLKDAPPEALEQILSTLSEVHRNLHVIAEAAQKLLAKHQAVGGPITNESLRTISEADLAVMPVTSEGN